MMIPSAGWICAEKMSPHIPKPSGQYQITHLLLRHVPSFYLRGLQLDNGLQWDKGVFMKWHIPGFMDSSSWQRLFSPFYGRNMRTLKTSGHLENNCLKTSVAAWCLVACLVSFVKFSISSLCFKTRKWCHSSRPNPIFHLKRGRGHTELDKGKKQGRAHKRAGQCVCVHLPRLFLGDE